MKFGPKNPFGGFSSSSEFEFLLFASQQQQQQAVSRWVEEVHSFIRSAFEPVVVHAFFFVTLRLCDCFVRQPSELGQARLKSERCLQPPTSSEGAAISDLAF
jgi:hypothetical protein